MACALEKPNNAASKRSTPPSHAAWRAYILSDASPGAYTRSMSHRSSGTCKVCCVCDCSTDQARSMMGIHHGIKPEPAWENCTVLFELSLHVPLL